MSPPIANAMNDAATVTPAQLATLLSYTIKAHEPVLVVCAPGIGKTEIGKQAAAALTTRICSSLMKTKMTMTMRFTTRTGTNTSRKKTKFPPPHDSVLTNQLFF